MLRSSNACPCKLLMHGGKNGTGDLACMPFNSWSQVHGWWCNAPGRIHLIVEWETASEAKLGIMHDACECKPTDANGLRFTAQSMCLSCECLQQC